jgi:colanic acid/amylovoran biosynthesis protein
MTKIVFVNHGSYHNKGSAAILYSKINTLKKLIPEANFVVFTYNPEIGLHLQDVKAYKSIGSVSLSRKTLLAKDTWGTLFRLGRSGLWWVLKKFFHWDFRTLRNEAGLNEYYDADVIINTGGDCLTEDYGTFSFLTHMLNLLFVLLLMKPIVLYAESIGPFKRWWNRAITRIFLRRVTLLTVREEITQQYLKKLGINKTKVYLVADPAFLLEPASFQSVKKIIDIEGVNRRKRPLVGMSVSRIISRYGFSNIHEPVEKHRKYIKIMAKITEYLNNTLKATVVFIPHVLEPWGNDDRDVADDIYKLLRNNRDIVSIKNEYSPEELKGIIGCCDLFVGARMHTIIASMSMGIPSIAIAYSNKAHGILGKMLGYERYVLDIKNLSYTSLSSAVNDAWTNRKQIRKELVLKMKRVKQLSLLSATLVKELVEQNRSK